MHLKVRPDRADAVIGAFAMRGAGGSSSYVNGRRRDWMREMEEGAGYGSDEAILREIRWIHRMKVSVQPRTRVQNQHLQGERNTRGPSARRCPA